MKRLDDHTVATIARAVVGAAAVGMGLVFLRTLPDLIRYAKMKRM